MISGILLAAGRSQRFGSQKLLIPFAEGLTLFEHSLQAHLKAEISPLVVVISEEIFKRFFETGSQEAPLYLVKSDPSSPWITAKTPWGTVRLMVNAAPQEGMSSSLKLGLRGLRDAEKEEGVLISLSDMPKITPEVIHSLIQTYREESADMVVPVCRGRIGHPVIFREPFYRKAVDGIRGDKGLRDLINSNQGKIITVPWKDDAVVLDVDTLSDLNKIFQKGVVPNGH